MGQRKRRTVGGGVVLSVLVCGLVCAICLMSDPLTRFLEYRTQARLAHANRLDRVVGVVEPLFLAEDQWNFPNLSPDGRWMLIAKGVRDDWSRERALMDMEAYRIYNIEHIPGGSSYWLDNHHFIMGHTIIKVPEMQFWKLEQLPDWKDDPIVPGQFMDASQVIAVEGRVSQAYIVISIDPEYPYTFNVRAKNESELATKLGDIPYTIVPESVWRVHASGTHVRLYSPDGKYFVSGGKYSAEKDDYSPQPLDKPYHSMIQPAGFIFDAQTEQMVAMANKDGWAARVLGWAPDSSGVYLQFTPMGGGYGFAPAGFPTYKLLVPGQQPSGKSPIPVEASASYD